MGLFLLHFWVVFTLFGVTIKWSKNFRYRITPFLELFNSSMSGVIFTPEKEFFKLLFRVKITPPQRNNSTVRSQINPTRGNIITL